MLNFNETIVGSSRGSSPHAIDRGDCELSTAPQCPVPLGALTSNVFVSVAFESPPTQTSNVDASLTHPRFAALQYRRSSGPTGNVTVFFSPGCSVTREKPFSSRTGRDAEP